MSKEEPTALAPTGPQAILPVGKNETATTAIAAQAVALVQARYTMAMHRPRDWDQVRVKLLDECKRPRFCETARYRLPFGQGIVGLSIRFAEAAIRCMGNLDPSVTVLYDDERQRIIRASMTDLESNVTFSEDFTISKTVERRKLKQGQESLGTRLNSTGQTLYIVEATEAEIAQKQAAVASKKIRTLGLRLLPGDIKEECEQRMDQTLADKDAADPAAALKRVVDNFAAIGVEPKHLVAYLRHPVAQMTPAEMQTLRGIFIGIKSGDVVWADVVGDVDDESRTDKLQAELDGKTVADAHANGKKADPVDAGSEDKARSVVQRDSEPRQPSEPATSGEHDYGPGEWADEEAAAEELDTNTRTKGAGF